MHPRPLNDRIFVRRLTEQESKRGLIFIPDVAKEKPQQAIVEAVGPGELSKTGHRHKPDVHKGDRILFGKYAGGDMTVDGVEYLILREDEILGVIEGADENHHHTTA